ncbi:unnamed protein product [Clavelina lepadiformis]|uniref:Uncharacterized protein n=1 Tax=Clavelina lepadiformis TaxID=159417 RepID=A0ABP0H0S8_CLALP
MSRPAWIYVVTLLSLGFVSAKNPRHLNEEDIARLTELSNNLIEEPTDLPIGKGCFLNSDCQGTWQCENVEAALTDAFNHTTHESDYERVKRKAKINGKECIRPIAEVVNAYPKEVIVERIGELLGQLSKIMEEADVQNFGSDTAELITASLDNVQDFNAPLIRVAAVAPVNPLSNLFFILALRGNDGASLDATTLILLSLFQSQQPGIDLAADPFSNPFLLYILLNNDDSGRGFDILLFFFIMNGNIGYPTAPSSVPRQGAAQYVYPSTNAFLSPFILYSLLDNSGSDSNLIFLYLLTNGGGSNPLLSFLLLSDNTSIDQDTILTYMLLGENSGGAGGFGSLLPILLLSNNSLGGGLTGGDNSLLTLLLLSGGLGGTDGLGSLLPILLLSDSTLGGGLGGDDSLITLLLLTGGLGGGGGYGDTGGLGSLLPILLLSNSSLGGGLTGGDNSLLTLLLLSGGLGGAGGINPLFLLELLNVTDSGIDPILLLALSGSFGTDSSTGVSAPTTGSAGINAILPYILIRESGSSDSLLLLFLLGFLQNNPSGYPSDPNTYG